MTQTQFTVGTTAIKVFTGPGQVKISAASGQTVYIGGSTVTSGDGLNVPSVVPFQAEIHDDSEVWAVTASGTGDLRVLGWY